MKDELIALAKEAGIVTAHNTEHLTIAGIERFAALVAANALELADKRIAELAKFHAELHVEHGKAKIRIGELECKLSVARDELLRCKRIMLHECGIGLVNEVVLAQIGGE